MKKLLPILVFFFLLIFSFTKPVYAQCVTNTFNFRVRDQNGNPLGGAYVPVNWKGNLYTYCSTDSSGQCYVCLSCTQPCELSGGVEYQGHTGSYSGAYNDGALIEVVINIPAPSPSPSPYPSPSPSPFPSPYPSPTPTLSLTCNPQEECDGSLWEQFRGYCERTSRQFDCKPCNATSLQTPSCAESFTVNDEVTFYWDQGVQCPEKPDEYWVYPEWGGIVTIDPSDTTIPFVGKQEEEDEKKYLADYFEGTHDYYRTYPLKVGPFKDLLHGVNPIFTTSYQGVLRKLTPMEYQNQLKKGMIKRIPASTGPVQEGKIHDYELNYIGRLCWDAPFWAEILAEIANRIAQKADIDIDFHRVAHYCLFRFNLVDDGLIRFVKGRLKWWNGKFPLLAIPYSDRPGVRDDLSELTGHEPPEPDEEDYVEKWNAWKESEGGKWFNLWQVAPMVSREDTPGEISPYLGWRPRDEPKYIPPTIEKVPHVARLYEASQEVNNMLLPYQEEGVVQKKAEPIIASAKKQVLGEKILLARSPPDFPYGCKWYFADWTDPDGPCACMGRPKPNGEPDCWGAEHGGCCPMHGYRGICGWSDCQVGPGTRCSSPPSRGCPGAWIVDDPSTPPTPACGLRDPLPVDACDKTAITDSNPNDDLCCDPIDINLRAVDSFKITTWYEECEAREGGPNPCGSKTRDVSRQFGINLSHPYLSEIWNQTGNANTAGLFNIFRPAKIPQFQEIDAADEIQYFYKGSQESVEPATGKFYFNYLGGVQLAKEWLIRALTPRVE